MSLRSKNKSIFDCAFQPDPNAKQNMNPIYTAPPTKIKSVNVQCVRNACFNGAVISKDKAFKSDTSKFSKIL
jgi:hypothetical protein